MKAIILKEPGGVHNLVPANLETPHIHDDEVLVAVRAISINPVDTFVRGNESTLHAIVHPNAGEPTVLGWDISGTVTEVGTAVGTEVSTAVGTEVGSTVTAFKPGDEVFGMVNFPGNGKAYAEYVAAPAAHLALKPATLSHEEAAAATLAALTAWQALVTHAKVQAGDKVLIQAAAGGVGHYAVQLAKALGAHTIGTASSANEDFVRELGADEFIDYHAQTVEEAVTDADVVLDTIRTPGHLESALNALKPGGRLITITEPLDDTFKAKLEAKGVFSYRMSVVSSGEDMAEVARLLGEGKLKSYVSKTFGLNDMPAAHEQVETGRTRGKVVVTVP